MRTGDRYREAGERAGTDRARAEGGPRRGTGDLRRARRQGLPTGVPDVRTRRPGRGLHPGDVREGFWRARRLPRRVVSVDLAALDRDPRGAERAAVGQTPRDARRAARGG